MHSTICLETASQATPQGRLLPSSIIKNCHLSCRAPRPPFQAFLRNNPPLSSSHEQCSTFLTGKLEHCSWDVFKHPYHPPSLVEAHARIHRHTLPQIHVHNLKAALIHSVLDAQINSAPTFDAAPGDERASMPFTQRNVGGGDACEVCAHILFICVCARAGSLVPSIG